MVSSRWSLVRLAVNSGLLRPTLMRVRARRVSTTFAPPKQTLLEVPNTKALRATPAWQQGDTALYAPEQLDARFGLRTSTDVQDALHLWWAAALRSLQSGGDMAACTVGHDRYVALCMSIYRRLVPGRVTSCVYQSAARGSAEKDWARDSKGLNALERADFLDGLFELADHYVPTVDAADYAAFLHELLHAVALPSSPDEAPLLWREKGRSPAVAQQRPKTQTKARAQPKAQPKARTPQPKALNTKRPLSPIGSQTGEESPISPTRATVHVERPLSPITGPTVQTDPTPLSPIGSTPSRAASRSSKRRLAASASLASLGNSIEREWLAAALGLEKPMLASASLSKRALPAVRSCATLPKCSVQF